MKRVIAPFALLLLGTVVPAGAQRLDAKGEGARFDAAILAGHAQAYAIAGLRSVTKAVTTGCATHLISGKEDWTIDWRSATIDDESSPSNLDVTMGSPDNVFSLKFGDRTKLGAARLAGRHLGAACAR